MSLASSQGDRRHIQRLSDPARIQGAGTRFVAVETPNEEIAWLVDRLSGNLYKCRAAEQGKATCEAETATGSIGEKAKR
jgi:hypothetical protein